MKDLTISQLTALGGEVTITFRAAQADVAEPAPQPAPVPAAEPQPEPDPAPAAEPTTPDLALDVIKNLLNEVALKISPEKARSILGKGKTLADITDQNAIYQLCMEALTDAAVAQ